MWLEKLHNCADFTFMTTNLSTVILPHILCEYTCLLFKILFQTSSPFKMPTLNLFCVENITSYFPESNRNNWMRSLFNVCREMNRLPCVGDPCGQPSFWMDSMLLTSRAQPHAHHCVARLACAISLACLGPSVLGSSHLLFSLSCALLPDLCLSHTS